MGASSFPELLLLLRKKAYALLNAVHYKFLLNYRVETAVCSYFGSEGKPMLQLSVVHYLVLLCLDTHDTDAIAINKLCKLNFMCYTMYLAISQHQDYQGFLKV